MKEVWKSYIRLRKKKFIAIAVVIILLILILGTQLVLYINFLIGNDLIVGLTSEQEKISLKQGESKSASFYVEVRSNPFCEVSCKGVFTELALQKILNEEVFKVQPGISVKKSFVISSDVKLESKELYRYDISCSNVKSVLCHTKESNIMRSAVVMVNYELNEENKKIREEMQFKLQERVKSVEQIEAKLTVWEKWSEQIQDMKLKAETGLLRDVVNKQTNLLNNWQELWKEQEIEQLGKEVEKDNFLERQEEILLWDNYVKDSAVNYNVINGELRSIKELLENSSKIFDENLTGQKKILAGEFNNLVNRGYDKDKLNKTLELKSKIEVFNLKAGEEQRKEVVEKESQLYVMTEALCKINSNYCFKYKTITEIAEMQEYNIEGSCEEITKFKEFYVKANNSVKVGNESVINAEEKVKVLIDDIDQKIMNNISNASVNYDLVVSSLPRGVNGSIGNYSNVMISSLSKFVPESCAMIEIAVMNVSSTEAKLNEEQNISLGINFEQPKKVCCALNRCSECCDADDCKNEPKFTPIIFIHGHAFNKDVSTEYSLNVFNMMQSKLEQEGYLNAGVLTVYAPNEGMEDWSGFNIPVTLKASYYYDAYEASGKYTLIQQKSEHIDDYALRLKEIVDNVQYRTGRPKVIIIAHSMGGLVARRYMQIFGEDKVDKLIMIGTPNKGIVGEVLSYCDILGEQRECEDMNADSVFMQKINSAKKFNNVKLYNIIGKGCEMDYNGQKWDGDGIVLTDYVKLDEAKNYYVKGTCSGLNFLHEEMLDLDKYPLVYDMVSRILKE